MGNQISMGIGILNNTNFKITVGLSMGATHYYENDVLPGQIFYRNPGDVWYTIYAYPTSSKTRLTDGQLAKEILTISLSSIAAAIAGILTLGTAIAPTALTLAPITHVGGLVGLATETIGLAAFDGVAGYYGGIKAANFAFKTAIEKSNLYAEMKGCYCGRSGTYIELTGGTGMHSDGYWQPGDFKMTIRNREYLWDRGSLTTHSYSCYHTKPGLPEAEKRV